MAAQSATPGDHSISLLGEGVFALPDLLDLKKTHLVGLWIGGMITQSVAATTEAAHPLAQERPKELIGVFLERVG